MINLFIANASNRTIKELVIGTLFVYACSSKSVHHGVPKKLRSNLCIALSMYMIDLLQAELDGFHFGVRYIYEKNSISDSIDCVEHSEYITNIIHINTSFT